MQLSRLLPFSGEFGGTDINNLSSNLSNHLKLENQDGAAVAGGGAGVGTAGPAMPKNNLNDPEASSSLMPAFQRQASQLDTPDVSSMSVDGGGGQQHSAAAARQQQQQQQLRNSLNKF